jgi:hypothetical protein
MSPAPETVRRPSNNSGSPPSLSISTILSRAPRTPNETPGPFSADRRASTSIRRNFSGGPRPAPFAQRTSPPTTTAVTSIASTNTQGNEEANSTRAMLISALESRRRRVEELRSQTNIATTIADQWRRQREEVISYRRGGTSNSPSPEISRHPHPPAVSVAPRLLLDEDTSDSDSEDDNDDNKWGINEPRRTPPPTFLTPNTSPSTHHTESPSQDDDSSRNAYILSCRYCANVLTKRGMRARLVADARVHIWSTDEQPR